MSSQHKGKFTWGVGPQKVCVAGNFNAWSGDATPLTKLDDGSFAADVPLPWGEKQAFKYVVDGEWKVREDEAKEWDAAGNMNNVYTAPHAPAPASHESAAPAAAAGAGLGAGAAAAAGAGSFAKSQDAPVEKAPIPSPGETHINPIPPADDLPVEKAPVPSPGPTNTDPFNAASPSSNADSGKLPATRDGAIPILGNVIGSTTTTNANTNSSALGASKTAPAVNLSAPNTDPASASPGHTAPVVNKSAPEAIEKVAANANIGQEATGEDHTLLERAQAYGLGAATTLTAALGQAAHAVEEATGIHLTQGDPMTVEEARAKGIDVDHIAKKDGPTDATSPVGQAPSSAAVADLEKKVQELKVANASAPASATSASVASASSAPVSESKKELTAVPLPGGEPPKKMTAPASDLPAVPKDEKPKHDLPAQNETKENHTSIPAPAIVAVSDRDPQKDRTVDAPFAADTAGTKPISADPAIDPKQAKKEAEQNPALTGSTSKTATSSNVAGAEAGATHRPDAPESNHTAPAPVKKDVVPGEAAPAPVPVAKEAPGTPVKATNGLSSANTTPASTPVKSTHGKEASSSSDVKKKKSGFLTKMKNAFSPKHKEKESK